MNIKRYIYYTLTTCFLIITVGGCSLTQKVEDGLMAYDRKQYSVAVEMLSEEYEDSNNRVEKAELAYYLGKSYEYLHDHENSLRWFREAAKYEYGLEAIREIAYSHKRNGNYEQAISTFENLNEVLGNDQNIKREIFILKEVSKWSTDTDKDVTISLAKMNSGYADYSPTLFQDRYLIFTSDRGESTGTDAYKWTGNKYTDLYIALKDGSQAQPFDAILNTDANEGTAVFNADYSEIIFTRCIQEGNMDDYCQLYTSDFKEGQWSQPRLIEFQKEGINYGQPALIEKDSVLIFAAEIESGRGGHDLYYSERLINSDSTSYWSEPYIMPQTINTEGNEVFPTADGDTLYFSSDYLSGLGGYDIFKTYLKSDGSWAPPYNMRKPINSFSDDFGYIVDRKDERPGIKRGYFTSSRDGMGNDDIYSFIERETISKDTTPEEIIPEEELDLSIYLAIKVVEPEYNIPSDHLSGESGYRPLKNARVTIEGSETEYFTTDDSGVIIKEVDADMNFAISGSKAQYFNDRKTVSTRILQFEEGELSTTLNVQLILNPIITNQEIVLENIYYDYDEWAIREDAKPTLDSLADILKLNPRINIELASHTDCRGENDYNLILSQKRAQAAVDYISTKGINGRRMTAKGYGENMPTIDCECDNCTDNQHQKNRRTAFKILE